MKYIWPSTQAITMLYALSWYVLNPFLLYALRNIIVNEINEVNFSNQFNINKDLSQSIFSSFKQDNLKVKKLKRAQ